MSTKHDPMWDLSACARCGALFGCDYLAYGPAADVCPECEADMAAHGDPQPTPQHVWFAAYEVESYYEHMADQGRRGEMTPDWDDRCYDGGMPEAHPNGHGGWTYCEEFAPEGAR